MHPPFSLLIIEWPWAKSNKTLTQSKFSWKQKEMGGLPVYFIVLYLLYYITLYMYTHTKIMEYNGRLFFPLLLKIQQLINYRTEPHYHITLKHT